MILFGLVATFVVSGWTDSFLTEASTSTRNARTVDSNWSKWSSWYPCSVTCGEGVETRLRGCTNPPPLPGERGCMGASNDSRACHVTPCPVDGQWGAWSTWTSCSRSCGVGDKLRTRLCDSPSPAQNGTDCPGLPIDATQCNGQNCPVAGGWTVWSEWSPCSKAGSSNDTLGYRSRTRQCTNPTPAYNGPDCQGSGVDVESCTPQARAAVWSQWTTWTCSATCGLGVNYRFRSCNDSGGCIGDDFQSAPTPCNVNCRVDGSWTAWSGWQACNVTCGAGYQVRTRSCTNPAPGPLGADCTGGGIDHLQYAALSRFDGGWSTWYAWTTCSVSCGNGSRSRFRTCSNPRPEHGGNFCGGNFEMKESCDTKTACVTKAVDGGWAEWESWTACSITCDTGSRSRVRQCTNPRPANNGTYCPGDWLQTVSCLVTHCKVDGSWSVWSKWSACDVTCENGSAFRIRFCDNPSPRYGGLKCSGADTDNKTCTLSTCPVDGQWSDWAAWSACSLSCGTGSRSRDRSCTRPAPQAGGKVCTGSAVETVPCQEGVCSVDGQWSAWHGWSSCSVTCGDGNITRIRTCTNPVPQHGGMYCQGDFDETSTCNKPSCTSTSSSCHDTFGHCAQLQADHNICADPALAGNCARHCGLCSDGTGKLVG